MPRMRANAESPRLSRGLARDQQWSLFSRVVATFATNAVYNPSGSFASVEVGVLIVDTATLAGFTFLALRSDRFWPLWVAGLQLTTVVAHGLKAVELELLPQAYAAAARFWVYPIFAIIVLGTWRGTRSSSRNPEPTPA